MKVWIVCDNNVDPSIILFDSLEKAQKRVDIYTGFELNDCWIFDENGSEVE